LPFPEAGMFRQKLKSFFEKTPVIHYIKQHETVIRLRWLPLLIRAVFAQSFRGGHCSADSEITIDRADDRFYTTGPNLLLLRGAHHVRTG